MAGMSVAERGARAGKPFIKGISYQRNHRKPVLDVEAFEYHAHGVEAQAGRYDAENQANDEHDLQVLPAVVGHVHTDPVDGVRPGTVINDSTERLQGAAWRGCGTLAYLTRVPARDGQPRGRSGTCLHSVPIRRQ